MNQQPLFAGATVFCPHPETGHCIYVSRRGSPDLLGGIPGGKVDEGEAFECTALREFYEETGQKLFALSKEPIFISIAKETNALCQVFLGKLTEESWSAFDKEFVGPEGLMVRTDHWASMMDFEEVAFADFNRRLFIHIQQNLDLKKHFSDLGLDKVHAQILVQHIEL